jgi:hypothetical protein
VSYVFDPTSGDTRAALAERVVFNSFSASRYAELVKRALNDAVTEICRRLAQNEAYEVLSYSGATGAVADPTLPWFRIDEVWTASATASASGEVAFTSAANYPLQPLDDHVLGTMTPTSPLYYIVRRRTSPTGFVPKLDVIIATPPAAGGFVAVKGLQRPAVMAADTDVTGLGADLDGAVVTYAKAQCFDNEDDFDAADRWMLRFEARLRGVIEGGVNDDGPDVVEGTWSC